MGFTGRLVRRGGVALDARRWRARASVRPQQRRDGRRGPRGPRGGNLDEVIEQGEAIVSDLLNAPYDERDYRTLTKANLEKMYVLLTREWYPAQQSHAWFVRELGPLIATQYPDLIPQNASDRESQSGSPMSQAGGVTEGESFSVGAGENSPAENADVSMIDRSMDDAVA